MNLWILGSVGYVIHDFMNWFQVIHYFLHLVFPGLFAHMFKDVFEVKWWKVYGVWLMTMLVDLDHLLADPIYDAARCSIGFHPLHSWWAIALYVCMILFPNFWVRVVGIGLLWHMVVDGLDCLMM